MVNRMDSLDKVRFMVRDPSIHPNRLVAGGAHAPHQSFTLSPHTHRLRIQYLDCT